MPPPVEPAHAPITIRAIKTTLENSGQREKSTVPKPVVVMIEPTEKETWCTASPTVGK